jgi:hypothetical protein
VQSLQYLVLDNCSVRMGSELINSSRRSCQCNMVWVYQYRFTRQCKELDSVIAQTGKDQIFFFEHRKEGELHACSILAQLLSLQKKHWTGRFFLAAGATRTGHVVMKAVQILLVA